VQLLKQRQDISSEEADQIIAQLESTRDSVLTTAQELQDAAKSQSTELRGRVKLICGYNSEELNPEGIKRAANSSRGSGWTKRYGTAISI